jgi:catechol 2,3-dioxygenase-like lactoylglutathione lyase family enzyme
VTRPFGSLDYLYLPAPDFEASVRFYTDGLGGELRWRIHEGSSWVAAVRVMEAGPLVLLASHLAPGEALPIHRVASPPATRRRLKESGWSDGPPFEIPQGPCLIVRDPGGQRLAIYERVRPQVEAAFEGRFDEAGNDPNEGERHAPL